MNDTERLSREWENYVSYFLMKTLEARGLVTRLRSHRLLLANNRMSHVNLDQRSSWCPRGVKTSDHDYPVTCKELRKFSTTNDRDYVHRGYKYECVADMNRHELVNFCIFV